METAKIVMSSKKIVYDVLRSGYAEIAFNREALDKKCLMQAWLQLVTDETTNSKILYVFTHKSDSSNPQKAIEEIRIDFGNYNVTEYYYPNIETLVKGIQTNDSFVTNNDVYFVVNGNYYFKCENCSVRNDWISAIINTTHTVSKKDQMKCIPFKDNNILNVKYTYKDINVSANKHVTDEKKDNSEMKNSGINIRFVPLNKESDKHFDILVSLTDHNKISMCIFSKILLNILAQHIYPKQTKMNSCKLVYSNNTLPCGSLHDFINHNIENLISSYTTKNSDRIDAIDNLIIEYDTTYYHGWSFNDSCFVGQIDGVCKDGLDCSIYLSMAYSYLYTKENYEHMTNFNHFKHDLSDKPVCRYFDKCYSFQRMNQTSSTPVNTNINSTNRHNSKISGSGHSFQDACHLLLFKHPPRTRRQLELSSIMNKLIMKSELETIKPQAMQYTSDNNNNNDSKLLILLINELIQNGYENDLYIQDSNDNNKNHKAQYNHELSFKTRHYTLLAILNEKLECIMHKIRLGNPLLRCEMLSLILYTGCDCNLDLCKEQRNGNYKKWYYFDICLYNAIKKLNSRETYIGDMKLYSGLSNVQLDKKRLPLAYFPTYVSSSYVKEVALSFMVHNTAFTNGMMMQCNENICKNFICCSVTWISKFSDECEILIARTVNTTNAAILSVVDHEHKQKYLNDIYSKINYQTVELDSFNLNKKNLILFNIKHVGIWNLLFENIFSINNNKLSLSNVTINNNNNAIQNKHYKNGIKIIYNIEKFQEYLKKVDQGYKIMSNDLIKMQQFKIKNNGIRENENKMDDNNNNNNNNIKFEYSPLKLFIKRMGMAVYSLSKHENLKVSDINQMKNDYPRSFRIFVLAFVFVSKHYPNQ